MGKLVLFNKPFNVLCQFTDTDNRVTLKDYVDIANVYPAGRLDRDSEGLLLLTDDGKLQHRIAHPQNKMSKCYWVQVEGIPDNAAIKKLCDGVELKDGMTRPAKCRAIQQPYQIGPRNPPIRYRKTVADSWLQLTINEGRNRQVRRMCAAVGYPVLRLIRYRIGSWTLDGLNSGDYRIINV